MMHGPMNIKLMTHIVNVITIIIIIIIRVRILLKLNTLGSLIVLYITPYP
jgi:hypothetical protein